MSDDASVLAEIARLTSAIEHHKSTGYASTPPPYTGRGGRGGRGRGRGRGGFARGGGGGAPKHRNATWVAPGLSTATTSRSSTPADLAAARASGGTTPVQERLGGLSVEGNGKGKERETEQEIGQSLPKPQPVPVKPQAREVVIDGVVFVADARGRKLVRKPDADPALVPSASAAPPSPSLSSTPKRTSHLGTTYIRTKAGNLVSLAFARKRKEQAEARKAHEEEMLAKGERLERLVGVVKGTQAARNAAGGGGRGGRGRGRGRGAFAAGSTRRTKPPKPKSDKPCRFFQRTGQCSRAHTCPYVHDSSHISLCPLFLRPSGCPRPSSTCPLSHTPNAHRSPHCAHFPACTRPNCPYAHVVVSKDAGVCHDFAEFGWCPRGEECVERHVRECWRFAETGKCEVKGCREPHVLRRKHDSEEEDEDSEEEDEDEEEGEEGRSALGGREEDGKEAAGAGSKRKRRESTDLSSSAPAGISGAAGRRLTKKLKQAARRKERVEGVFGEGGDFVELMVPLSDDDEDEEEEEEEDGEEGMSVDSEDLDEEDDDDDEDEDEEEEQEEEGAEHPPPDLLHEVHLAKKDPPAPSSSAARPRTSSATATVDQDELDYGLSDDEDDAIEIEQMLRR
ncbi:hypothetical protein JCM6882_003508 [Rhodosporidiobolus microsporus]